MELFDSHAHYNDEKFDEDREDIINKAYNSGVTRIINAGYSILKICIRNSKKI